MRVFVTGATGFIGSAVVEELIGAGHSVTALARSEEAGKKLSAKGVQPHLGNLDDTESLRSEAAAADAVIPLAYMHALSQIPFGQRLRIIFGGLPTSIVSRFLAVSADADRRAIDTIGAAFKGSGRPLVTTFGTLGLSPKGSVRRNRRRKRMSPTPSRRESTAQRRRKRSRPGIFRRAGNDGAACSVGSWRRRYRISAPTDWHRAQKRPLRLYR